MLPSCSPGSRPGEPASSSFTKYSLREHPLGASQSCSLTNSSANNKFSPFIRQVKLSLSARCFLLCNLHTIAHLGTQFSAKCTINRTGAYHEQQYFISRSGNQTHPPVTHLNQPQYLGVPKNKKIQVHTLAEKLMSTT